MKIYYLPIEPYETRYTADWIAQFTSEFNKAHVEYEVILGETDSTKVTDGGVLDACGTHTFKFTQLLTLIGYIKEGKIKSNDVIFFADLWFPGLESLFYIRSMLGVNFKICGILHAGTYDKYDFTYRNNMRSWGAFLENSWLVGVDKVFVATKFHKNLILNGCSDLLKHTFSKKITVTGIPFYAEQLRKQYDCSHKENIVVFPHRLDPEKCPEKFDILVDKLRNRGVDFIPVKTIEETKSRDDYFRLLAKSKVMVSFANQETFGYSTVESMALGNIVFVPNRLSYVETVPEMYRYDDEEYLPDLIETALSSYYEPKYDLTKWSFAIQNMITLCKEFEKDV